MKVLVIGASPNPNRYSFKATKLLKNYGHQVFPVGIRDGEIDGLKILKEFPLESDIHTVTIYLSPKRQEPYYEKILALKPKRVIFNPGTENPAFRETLAQNGIETVENCTIVMLKSGIF